MRKVLIIGGNGFIGSNLARFLLTKNLEVYSFDMIKPQCPDSGIHYLQGDFFDDNTLRTIIQDKDIVYHAISTVNPGNSNDKYMMGYSRDFIQTIKLCIWLSDLKTKLIFLSSGGTVYGNQKIQPITEDTLPRPINHYGNIKLCIENTLRVFDVQTDAKMLIARISNPYGPGQDFTKGVGFVDAVLKKTLKGETVEIWGDGEVIRDYIYIDDVCKMLYQLSKYDGNEVVFNISSNEGNSQNEIINIVRKIDNRLDCVYKDKRSVDADKIILDNSKIREIYKDAVVSLKDGIEMYYNYLSKN